MSLGELLTYSKRRRLRVGIATNGERRTATPNGRMVCIEARWPGGALYTAAIAEPGGFAELELAAADLLAELRHAEEPE